MSKYPKLAELIEHLPDTVNISTVSIHARTDDDGIALLAAMADAYGTLPDPKWLNTTTYTVEVGCVTAFLPASLVEVAPEPRPEPLKRTTAELLGTVAS